MRGDCESRPRGWEVWCIGQREGLGQSPDLADGSQGQTTAVRSQEKEGRDVFQTGWRQAVAGACPPHSRPTPLSQGIPVYTQGRGMGGD